MADVIVLCSNLRGLILNCSIPNGIVKIVLKPAVLSALDGVTAIPQETIITEEEYNLIEAQFRSNPVWNQISVVKKQMGKTQAEDLNASAQDFAPVNTNLEASGQEVVEQAKEVKAQEVEQAKEVKAQKATKK